MIKLTHTQLTELTKQLDCKLPEEWTDWGYEEDVVEGEFLFLAGMNVDREKKYIINIPVIHRVNHVERIKKINKDNGVNAVISYLEKYGIGVHKKILLSL